jgi:hypothetical protein
MLRRANSHIVGTRHGMRRMPCVGFPARTRNTERLTGSSPPQQEQE